MGTKDDPGGVFLTQKSTRRVGQVEDAVDADQLEEMVAGVAQTSQSTLLLKKKKEMREVRILVCRSYEYMNQMYSGSRCRRRASVEKFRCLGDITHVVCT